MKLLIFILILSQSALASHRVCNNQSGSVQMTKWKPDGGPVPPPHLFQPKWFQNHEELMNAEFEWLSGTKKNPCREDGK